MLSEQKKILTFVESEKAFLPNNCSNGTQYAPIGLKTWIKK